MTFSKQAGLFLIIIANFCLISLEAQDYRRDGQGVRTKRWTGETVSKTITVDQDSERNFSFEMESDEYEYRFQLVQEETGYFRPGCDWVFRHTYDPRWDVYTRIPRDHYFRRAQLLSELIDGVDYQMALVIVEDGRFLERPGSFREYQEQLQPYYLSDWVMHGDYYHDNLVRLGAIRPGWEIECGGEFVHIVYDKLRTKKTKTGNLFSQEIQLDIEGPILVGKEEDRFEVFFDGHRAWVRADRRNRNRYSIERVEDEEFHYVAIAKGRNLLSNDWNHDYVAAELRFDWRASSLVLEFEDKGENPQSDHDTIVYITLKQINRWRNSTLLDEEPVFLQREADFDGERYLINLDDLVKDNWKSLQRGKRYYVWLTYKRSDSDLFRESLSSKKRFPSSSGVKYER